MDKPKFDIAFGVKRVSGGWTLVEYHIRDGKIIKQTQTEPDFRDLTLEQFVRRSTVFWLPPEE